MRRASIAKRAGQRSIRTCASSRSATRGSLSQLILRTDVAGMPLEWIDYKEAARLYHPEQVAYTCGSALYELYGGTCAQYRICARCSK